MFFYFSYIMCPSSNSIFYQEAWCYKICYFQYLIHWCNFVLQFKLSILSKNSSDPIPLIQLLLVISVKNHTV